MFIAGRNSKELAEGIEAFKQGPLQVPADVFPRLEEDFRDLGLPLSHVLSMGSRHIPRDDSGSIQRLRQQLPGKLWVRLLLVRFDDPMSPQGSLRGVPEEVEDVFFSLQWQLGQQIRHAVVCQALCQFCHCLGQYAPDEGNDL